MKSISVTVEGEAEGYEPPLCWRGEVAPDGMTRLVVSAPDGKLRELALALAEGLSSPVSVRWVQMVDRRKELQHSKPKSFVAVEKPRSQVLAAMRRCSTLLFDDGRGQLWLRGKFREQILLDELGMIWIYPDDPSFRDILEGLGVPEDDQAVTMGERDYVKVLFEARADGEEELLIRTLGLAPQG